jgi:hypothetical protein
MKKKNRKTEKKKTKTHRKVAFGRGNPKIRTSSIKQNREVLRRAADANLTIILSVHEVAQRQIQFTSSNIAASS